jgi:hypothetical protein
MRILLVAPAFHDEEKHIERILACKWPVTLYTYDEKNYLSESNSVLDSLILRLPGLGRQNRLKKIKRLDWQNDLVESITVADYGLVFIVKPIFIDDDFFTNIFANQKVIFYHYDRLSRFPVSNFLKKNKYNISFDFDDAAKNSFFFCPLPREKLTAGELECNSLVDGKNDHHSFRLKFIGRFSFFRLSRLSMIVMAAFLCNVKCDFSLVSSRVGRYFPTLFSIKILLVPSSSCSSKVNEYQIDIPQSFQSSGSGRVSGDMLLSYDWNTPHYKFVDIRSLFTTFFSSYSRLNMMRKIGINSLNRGVESPGFQLLHIVTECLDESFDIPNDCSKR